MLRWGRVRPSPGCEPATIWSWTGLAPWIDRRRRPRAPAGRRSRSCAPAPVCRLGVRGRTRRPGAPTPRRSVGRAGRDDPRHSVERSGDRGRPRPGVARHTCSWRTRGSRCAGQGDTTRRRLPQRTPGECVARRVRRRRAPRRDRARVSPRADRSRRRVRPADLGCLLARPRARLRRRRRCEWDAASNEPGRAASSTLLYLVIAGTVPLTRRLTRSSGRRGEAPSDRGVGTALEHVQHERRPRTCRRPPGRGWPRAQTVVSPASNERRSAPTRPGSRRPARAGRPPSPSR